MVTDRGIELLRNNPERVDSRLLKSFRGHLGDTGAEERELISERTKTALAAAKVRGRKLGSLNGAAHLRPHGNSRAVEVVRQEANERAERLRRIVSELGAGGITSANGLAKALNERHLATSRGGTWTARSVLNVLARLEPTP